MKFKYGDEKINRVFRPSVFQEQFKRNKGETVQDMPEPEEEPEEVEGNANVPVEEPVEPSTQELPDDQITQGAEDGSETVPEESPNSTGTVDAIRNKKELKKAEEFSTYDVNEFVHAMETELNITLNELESRMLKRAQVLTKNFPQDKRVEIMHRLNDYFDEKIDYIKTSLMRMIDKAKRGI